MRVCKFNTNPPTSQIYTQKKRADLANGSLFSVGVTRLELATSRPPDAYSNQLSYTPISFLEQCCFPKAMQS